MIALGVVLMSQLLLPCYIAQEIESSSELFASLMLQCNWIGADLKLKKSMAFFMTHLSSPVIKFELFTVVDVNLKTFLSVS
jgi:hypothetical protein